MYTCVHLSVSVSLCACAVKDTSVPHVCLDLSPPASGNASDSSPSSSSVSTAITDPRL